MKIRISRTSLLIAGFTVLGVALRLINIGAESYWADEILSLDIVRHVSPLTEMIRYVAAVEFHPPLYYIMLRGWTDLFGTSETATRSLSLVFSALTIPLIYVFGKRLFKSERAGIIAALITAVMPFAIEYGQEARPYAIFCFFGMVAAFCAWERLRGGKKAYAIGYVVASLIGLYLHYSYFFVLGATSTWWLLEAVRTAKGKRSKAFMEWLVVHAAIFVGFLPWVPALLYKLLLGQFTFSELLRRAVPGRSPDIFFNAIQQLVWLWPPKTVPPINMIGEFVFIPIFGWSLYALPRKGQSAAVADMQPSGSSVAYVAWLLIVPLVLFIFAPQSRPYTTIDQRHVIFCTVPIALLLALVMSKLSKKMMAVVLSIFLISLIPYVSLIVADDAQWDPDHSLRSVGAYIAQYAKPGDVIVVPVSIMRIGLAHYLPDSIPILPLRPFDFYGNDIWASRHTLGIIENEDQVRVTAGSTADVWKKMDRIDAQYHPKRVWLFDFSDADVDEHSWFQSDHWRRAFSAISTVFPVDLYIRH